MPSQQSETKPPSEKQIRLLGKMLHRVLLEIRGLGNQGMAEQAADLADAFHNLPVYMFDRSFDWLVFRDFLEEYQDRYPRPKDGHLDYLTFLDRIEQDADDID